METHSRFEKLIKVHQFRMVTLATIILALEQGDWFLTLNLQDAYFHITIDPSDRRFLRFVLEQDHYQYKILLFGLSVAPRVFSMVLAMVTAHLCKQEIMIFPYLNGLFIQSRLSRRYPSSNTKDNGPFLTSRPPIKHSKIDTDTCTAPRIYWGLPQCIRGQSLIANCNRVAFTSHKHPPWQSACAHPFCIPCSESSATQLSSQVTHCLYLK